MANQRLRHFVKKKQVIKGRLNLHEDLQSYDGKYYTIKTT